jgi:glucose/arabinose dehydrogenase
VLSTPFLDITSLVQDSGEQGLLVLAFHPNFVNNGYFFVNYSEKTSGRTVIARHLVSPSSSNVTTSRTVLKTIDQPYTNHNGGAIQFGPDGYLYIGMGDGGSSNDPLGSSQNVNTCGSKNCCEYSVLFHNHDSIRFL